MGRPLSLAIASFSGIRVAGDSSVPGSGIQFTPAHIRQDGKPVSSKAVFTAFCNGIGEYARNDPFSFTLWGPRAETFCKCAPPGKAIDVVCEPQSYLGRSFDQNGQVRNDAAGQPIMVRKVGFNILRISYGEDATKRIQSEKNFSDGNSPRALWDWRPMFWDNEGHPDNQVWKELCKNRNAANWNGTDPIFGYARLVMPNGTLDWTKINKGLTPGTAAAAPGGNPNPQVQQPAVQQQANPQAPSQIPASVAAMMGGGAAAPAGGASSGNY